MDRRKSRKKPKNSRYGTQKKGVSDDSALAGMLPATVTSIQTQARNSTRASVFLDGAFFRGFKSETLKRHSISSGKKLTPELFNELIKTDGALMLREYLLNRLADREHTIRELEQKARRKKLDMTAFDETIEDLKDKGLLSEERFAVQFFKAKRNRGWGLIKIKSELMNKGLSSSQTDLYLPEPGTDELLGDMKHLVEKNKRRFSRELDIFKRKKKIYDHLIRKGFPSGEIMKYLNELAELTD